MCVEIGCLLTSYNNITTRSATIESCLFQETLKLLCNQNLPEIDLVSMTNGDGLQSFSKDIGQVGALSPEEAI